MKISLSQVAIFLGGVALGLFGAYGVWKKASGRGDVMEAPAFDTKERVAAKFHEVIMDFCKNDYTKDYIFERFAPGGAIRQGQGQVPSPTKASYIETETLYSLVTTDAATRVIWWLKPKDGTVVQEIHVVPDASARIVEYAAFVKQYDLGPSKKLSQSAALGDIPHVHDVRCDGKELIATLQQIAWAGDFIGKMGEMVLTKGHPDTPYQRQLLTDP